MQRKPVRAGVTAATMMSGLLVAGPLQAAPRPSAEELGRQAEIITEQYNGKRLALARARQARRSADAQLRRSSADYARVRSEIGALAAARYMTPGAESEVALFTTDAPQTALDQSAATRYLSTQQTERLRMLVVTRMRYERSAALAKQHVEEIEQITTDLAKKKARIEKLIDRIPASQGGSSSTMSVPGSGKASVVINAALSRAGMPYEWGAAGPGSFDCSGLMLWAYQKVGLNLPHYTGAQYDMGTRISSLDQVRPGDILFFYPDLGHNGMYIGGGKMVHAPRSGKDVEVVDLASYWGAQFVGASRILS